jgi:hypothetical protein
VTPAADTNAGYEVVAGKDSDSEVVAVIDVDGVVDGAAELLGVPDRLGAREGHAVPEPGSTTEACMAMYPSEAPTGSSSGPSTYRTMPL